VSRSRIEAYRRCSKAGMTLQKAADRLGITLCNMRKAAKRYELPFKGYHPQAPLDLDALNASYREAAAEGLTSEEAAQRFGVLAATVRGRARRLGIMFAGQRHSMLRDCNRGCPDYNACRARLRRWDGVLCEKEEE